MQVRLHLVKGNPKGKTVEVPEGMLTVGRAEDSDLIIASTRVSRHHCEIVNAGGGLAIRDKGSGNGTLVNGTRVQEQTLTAGDELQIGPLTFAVEIDGRREKAAKPGAKHAAQAKPAAPAQKPAARAGKPAPNDIFASLERMAGPKGKDQPPSKPAAKPPKKDKDDVLEISDEDLLES